MASRPFMGMESVLKAHFDQSREYYNLQAYEIV